METADLQELLIEREWRKCAPDWDSATTDELVEAFDHWCRKYVFIRFPGKGRIPFELRDAQRETARMWIEHRWTIALKARQIGFSTLTSLFAFWACFFYPDRVIIMLSRTERDSRKLLRHARYAYKYLPDWMKLRGPYAELNQDKISFSNESEIESLPSASDPARGNTAWITVVDEMGQLPNSEDAWASIEPTADAGGRVVMLGTANGEGNLFHKLWVGSRGEWVDRDGKVHPEGTGQNRFKSIFHGWWSDGKRDQAWFDQQCVELPEWQRAQEYPDNPDEAFLKSGRPVFDLTMLRGLETEDPIRGWLDSDTFGEFIESPTGALRVWAVPEERKRYTIGADVAEGLEHGDFSSIHVIESGSGRVVAHWHGHIDADLLGSDILLALGMWYNRALVLVESNNHGLTTLTALRREKYFPLYHQKRLASRNQKDTTVMGWRTTVASKPLAVDELNRMLRDGDVKLYDRDTIAELRTFTRDERGRMAGVPHDDRVMSLAIAAQGLKHVHDRKYQPRGDGPRPGSIEWHFQQLSPKRMNQENEPVGAFATAS